MRISLHASIIMACVFAVMCSGFAISGFISLGDITDPTQASDARGFALFWTFLASVATALGALAWWISRTQAKDEDA